VQSPIARRALRRQASSSVLNARLHRLQSAFIA